MTEFGVHFLTAGAIAAALGFPVIWVLTRMGVYDNPNARSSHSVPVVRGGGIAILTAVLTSSLIFGTYHYSGFGWLALALFVLAAVSFVDDLRSVGSAIRFGCQLAAAALVIYVFGLAEVTVRFSAHAFWSFPLVAGAVIAGIWIAGYTNAFNFMDGINGIAGLQALITGAGMALISSLATGGLDSAPEFLAVAVAGGAAGFLPFNFPKAKMFLGDVGSAPVGFLLAVLVLWLSRDSGGELLIPLALLHANFVMDTGITLVRRALRGEKWYEPHREHFYQKLLRTGKTHPFVTGREAGLQVLVLLLMTGYVSASPLLRGVLAGVVIAVWLGFFLWVESGFKRSSARVAGLSAG